MRLTLVATLGQHIVQQQALLHGIQLSTQLVTHHATLGPITRYTTVHSKCNASCNTRPYYTIYNCPLTW